MKSSPSRYVIPAIWALAMAGLSYLGRVDGYVQRAGGLLSDKYDGKTAEEVIGEASSWKDAKNYLMTHLTYSFGEDNLKTPFRAIHEKGKENCEGGATAGATLLSDDDRYETEEMTLWEKSNALTSLLDAVGFSNHAVCLVYDTKTKKYGSLGINPCDCIKPKYDTKKQVFSKINRSFLGMFENYSTEEYLKESLVDGIHPVKEAMLRNRVDEKLNGRESKMFIAYTPFELGEDFERQKFVFVGEDELGTFDYQDANQWSRLYAEREKLTGEQFIGSMDVDTGCSFFGSDAFSKKNFEVYSE